MYVCVCVYLLSPPSLQRYRLRAILFFQVSIFKFTVSPFCLRNFTHSECTNTIW